MKKQVLFFISALVFFGAEAQTSKYIKGGVLDAVEITSSSTETYASYVPANYDERKKWPVVYVFDPKAAGAEAIKGFISGAEDYGYVVIASNIAKNGDYQTNFRHISRLMNEVNDHFSIDPNRIILSGFSGAARLAAASAVLSKNISAVIGCGASFDVGGSYMPVKNTFMYVGVIGDEDFNYIEMLEGVNYLDMRKFDTELIVFKGGHEWPEEEYISKALRSLSVKYMAKGLQKRDDVLLERYYQVDYEEADRLLKKGDLLYSYDAFETMIENFRFFKDVDPVKDKLKEIKRSNLYKAQLSEYRRIVQAESLYRDEYYSFLPGDIELGDTRNLTYWSEEIEKINDLANSPKMENKKMAKRLRGLLAGLAGAYEKQLIPETHAQNLLFVNILYTILLPEEPAPYLKTVQFATMMGKYDMALYYLEDLLKSGYKNIKELDNLEGIALLRISTEYNDLLTKYDLKTRY
ncbi:alpha/beta hydrolase [Zhouia spongiae]|uniref:Alpha/beta hydrolase n=1 Tax=Zhouia spongiae TaxID=2202721 RepID=A0ABY3YI42_9FLAO|nr:alpha/beta hydrolase [Zhouia spongiae]UNY97370.1 alpha/beta hydrolase [Zhouia spongiae]